jgi:glutamate racemase
MRKNIIIQSFSRNFSKHIPVFVCCVLLFISACSSNPSGKPEAIDENSFLYRVLHDTSDYYYLNLKSSGKPKPGLPIGMFDSGTGGLTVLNAMVEFDNFKNSGKRLIKGSDGIKDFTNEEFIYFGDIANMPYGNYPESGKTGFLKELILRDALFLMGNKYYRSPDDRAFQKDKLPVKLIVIACNTATAIGRHDIEDMLSAAGSKIKVIGVIDAGVRGALSTFGKDEAGTLAVMATAGTVASNGYLNAFLSLQKSTGHMEPVEFIQQAGAGIAEAIDEEPAYIDRKAVSPRAGYKGPSMSNRDLKITGELLPVYNFDTSGNALLRKFKDNQCIEIQLNSPENYFRYYLVSLCEQIRNKPGARPLKRLILGCTHYPFYTSFIREKLRELYNLKINDSFIYREVLTDSIIIIDPAENTSREVYEYLAAEKLFNSDGNINKSEFFISVPDNLSSEIKTDSLRRFTFEYKYSRDENHFYDTKQVPVSRLTINDEITGRLARQIPSVYSLIRTFDSASSKTSFLKPGERF